MRRALAGATAPALLAALLGPGHAAAGGLGAVVRDEAGEAVSDAVVYALPLDARGEPLPPPPPTEIDQIDKEFVPYVTAVRTGTRIRFPNGDQIRHHVYSFSEAKTFEIPLYKGTPAEPILFDKPGPVVLGCNIHDWMRAYVFVVDTPFFAVTDADGRASLEGLEGEYAVRVWHPELAGVTADTTANATVRDDAIEEIRFVIERKPVWRPRRAPSLGGPDYR